VWTGCIWLRIGLVAGPCEHGNEPSGSMKGGEFINWLSDYWLLRAVSYLCFLYGIYTFTQQINIISINYKPMRSIQLCFTPHPHKHTHTHIYFFHASCRVIGFNRTWRRAYRHLVSIGVFHSCHHIRQLEFHHVKSIRQ